MIHDGIVIIADLRGSRKMQTNERYEGQLFLKSAIVQVNENHPDRIEAPFMITRGDEFQGVLGDMASAIEIMLEFERILFPLPLRYGMGRGMINKFGSDIPLEMDGPAFHRANEALSALKRKKQFIMVKSENEMNDQVVNALFSLLCAIKSRWNATTFERYWKYKEMGTFEKVAKQEGVSAQAIWESMKNMRTMEVIEAEKDVIGFYRQEASTHQ